MDQAHKTDDPNLRAVLELSTRHVPCASAYFGKARHVEHEYGWVVWVADHPPGEIPEWLAPIMKKAAAQLCLLIVFDRDADGFEEFTSWAW